MKEDNKSEIFDAMLRKLIVGFQKKGLGALDIILILEMNVFNAKFSFLCNSQPALKNMLKNYENEIDEVLNKNRKDKD